MMRPVGVRVSTWPASWRPLLGFRSARHSGGSRTWSIRFGALGRRVGVYVRWAS